MVSLFALAFSRSSRACSSVYFGVGVAVGEALLIMPVLLFALAFAPAFMFDSVLLQATSATPSNTIAPINKRSFFIFSVSFLNGPQEESPASPLAGDLFADIFHGIPDFTPGLPHCLLQLSFSPFLSAFRFQVWVIC